jgi:hypothetical protein
MQTTKYVFLASNLAVNILLSGLISFLWRILGALTSLTILSLISVPIQGPAKIINSFILGFSQLDILPSEIIINQIFNLNSD